MLYHLSFPQTLFIEEFVGPFERFFPGENKILIVTNEDNKNNGCDIPQKLLLYKGSSKEKIINIINRDRKAGVLVYWLNDDLLDIVEALDSGIKVYFRSYSNDLHPIIYKHSRDFIKKETKKMLGLDSHLDKLKYFIRPFYHLLIGRTFKKIKKKERLKRFFKRIYIIGTVTNYEYELLKNRVPDLTNQNILTVSKIIPKTLVSNHVFPQRKKNNIVVGHSAFPINNHLDVFKKIEAIKGYEDFKIIVPLNYGLKEYREKVISEGKKIFGYQFEPITTYLNKEEYFNILNNCESFILNSYIQQGGANVHQFLLEGGKVYLDKDNPIYIDKKKEGFTIFSIQNDLTADHLFNYHLSVEEKIKNRNLIIENLYGEKIVEKRTKQIFNLLLS